MGLFKKSKERQLKQDIRKGLRKNKSVSVSTDGVVTGDGGDKVKLSGRGRRTAAKEEAARRFSGDTELPGGGSSTVTAGRNIRRKVVTPTSETTKDITTSKGKDRANYNVTGTRGSDNRVTSTKLEQGKRESAGSVEVQGKQNKLGNAYSFGSSTLPGTIKDANQGISDVRERGNQGLTNKSKTGFFMRSTPFNKPGDAESRFSSTTTNPQPGVSTTNVSGSGSSPTIPGGQTPGAKAEPADWNAFKIANPGWTNPNDKKGTSFSGTSNASTVSLEKVTPNVISSSVSGTNNKENFSYGGGSSNTETVVETPKVPKDRKQIRATKKAENLVKKQNRNVSRGKCPPCNC